MIEYVASIGKPMQASSKAENIPIEEFCGQLHSKTVHLNLAYSYDNDNGNHLQIWFLPGMNEREK